MKNIALALAVAAGTIAGTAAPALAETKSVEVSYADLDLNSAEDREVLESRMDKAARRICQIDSHGTGARLTSKEARECYADARQKSAEAFATILESKRMGG